jgi:hypothetical protein
MPAGGFGVADLQLYAFQLFHLWQAFTVFSEIAFLTLLQKVASFSSAFLLRAFFMRFTSFHAMSDARTQYYPASA